MVKVREPGESGPAGALAAVALTLLLKRLNTQHSKPIFTLRDSRIPAGQRVRLCRSCLPLPKPQTRQSYVVGWRAAEVRSTPYRTKISNPRSQTLLLMAQGILRPAKYGPTPRLRRLPYAERGGWGQTSHMRRRFRTTYREAYVWCPCKTDKRAAWLVKKLALAPCPRRSRRRKNHSTGGKNTLSRYITPIMDRNLAAVTHRLR